MEGLLAAVAILIMIIVVILSIPLLYDVSVTVKSPFLIKGRVSWLGRALYADWSYEEGSQPNKTIIIGWKKQAQDASDVTSPKEETLEAACDAIEDAENSVTYDEVKDAADTPASPSWKDRFWWRKLVLNRPFGQVLFTFVLRLLHHSRIRQLTFNGTIGLAQPHETGWLAAACYSLVPASIDELYFDYTDEIYDFQGHASGRIHPASLLMDSLAFISTRPARQAFAGWRQQRKEHQHGQ